MATAAVDAARQRCTATAERAMAPEVRTIGMHTCRQPARCTLTRRGQRQMTCLPWAKGRRGAAGTVPSQAQVISHGRAGHVLTGLRISYPRTARATGWWPAGAGGGGGRAGRSHCNVLCEHAT